MLNMTCLVFVPMSKTLSKKVLTISLAAIFGVAMIASPIAVDAMGSFLDIKSASVDADTDELNKAVIKTFGHIPKNNAAIGYAVGTTNFDPVTGGTLIVATTHPGVLDSEDQKGDIMSPKWHNHYVEVGAVEACDGVGVLDISYESPGKVKVKGKKIELKDVPLGDVDTHFGLAPNALNDFSTGETIPVVGSFQLRPLTGAGGLEAVCVDNVNLFAIP